MSTNKVIWTRDKLERFKRAYTIAPGDRSAVFTFDGNEYVKGYAMYLIEYLETRLPKGKYEA